MSFSKARIQRFNEHASEAPPPGTYDPKFDTKIKGSVIEKTDRFLDCKSTNSAECNLSESGRSNVSIPVFRTPQMPRKHAVAKSGGLSYSKTKDNSISLVRTQSMKYEFNQQLADLKVECMNKDKTIQEHEKYIEEMKDDLRKLVPELEELRKKQIEVEQQHTKDIETMAKLQQEVLNNHDAKHEAELQILRSQLLDVSEEKEREFSARKKTEGELRSRADELSRRIATLEAELHIKKEENETKIEDLETRIEELLNTLEIVECDRNTEIGLLLKEKCQVDMCVADLTQERSILESKVEKRQSVILELQAQLSALQCELDELKAEYEKLADDSIKRVSDLADKHDKEVERLKDDFLKERNELLIEMGSHETRRSEAEAKANEIVETNLFLTNELKDVQRLYKDVSRRLFEAQRELELSNEKHALMIEKYKKDLDDMKNQHAEEKLEFKEHLNVIREEHSKEMENVASSRNKEFDKLKQASTKKIEEETKRVTEHAQKMIENAEAIARETLAACRAESEERVKRTIVECDEKVNVMIREARSTVEEEMRLSAERYETCLARMEMERAALDEKLSQRDAQITKLSATLEDLRSSAETQESFSQSLQAELDKAEAELAEKKEELRALKDHIRTESAEMVARKKRFEVVMAENQASVVALTNRLAQSNAEVERLQHELECGENCIHEHRDLLNMMRNNSQLVQEQVNTLMEELDAQREKVDQLEADSLCEFKSLKPIFEAKIQNFKQTAAKEIARLKSDFEKKSLQNDEIKKELHEMATNLNKTQDILLKLEEQNDIQAINLLRMELENNKLKEDLKNSEEALKESYQLLEARTAQYEEATCKVNRQADLLLVQTEWVKSSDKYKEETALLLEQEQMKHKDLETKTINRFMQQLEEEKARRVEAEEELKRIQEFNSRLKYDYEEMSEKYAEIIGHQNPKQRIKHLAQLKDKIFQLEQELCCKNRLVEMQQKTIEKLKTEEKRSHWKGKENIGIIHSTPVSSPHKTTPLRDRND